MRLKAAITRSFLEPYKVFGKLIFSKEILDGIQLALQTLVVIELVDGGVAILADKNLLAPPATARLWNQVMIREFIDLPLAEGAFVGRRHLPLSQTQMATS